MPNLARRIKPMIRLEQLDRLPLFLLSEEEKAIKAIMWINNPKLNLTHIDWRQLENESRELLQAQEALVASRDDEEITNEEHEQIEPYISLCSDLMSKYESEYIRRKTNG